VGQKGTIFFIPFFFLLDDSVLGSAFEVSAVASAGVGLLLPAADCVDPCAGVAACPPLVSLAGVGSNGVAADKLLGDDSELFGDDSDPAGAGEEVSGGAAFPEDPVSII
jgi:hypothetical protein